MVLGFKVLTGGASGKETACQWGDARDLDLIPGSRRSPGGKHGNPLQSSCPENPMDRGAWRAAVHGVAKSQTRLNTHTLVSRQLCWRAVGSAAQRGAHVHAAATGVMGGQLWRDPGVRLLGSAVWISLTSLGFSNLELGVSKSCWGKISKGKIPFP